MPQVVSSFHLIASPQMGGAEISFIRHTNGLRRAGHRVSAGLRSGSQLARTLEGSMPVKGFAMSGNLDVRSAFRIRAAVRQSGADVVQSWASRATWLTRAVSPAIHVARLGGYYKPRYFRHADAWLVNTRGLWSWMVQNGFPRHRVEWVPNFVPMSPVSSWRPARTEFAIPEDALLVVGMGRFIEKKGFADLITAFLSLKPEYSGRPLHLMLIGNGERMRQLRRLASANRHRIHFAGWIADPLPLLTMADVFVCPSREEPLGNVVLEAWSRELPVICTRTLGGRELVTNNQTGILVDVASASDMARALTGLLSDSTRRRALAMEGKQYLQNNFCETRSIAATVDFYRKIRSQYATHH